MYGFWQSSLIAVSTIGFVIGVAAVSPPLAIAPPTDLTTPELPSLDEVESIAALYELRDRLQVELETGAAVQGGHALAQTSQRLMRQQAVQTVEIKIHIEEQAIVHLESAQRLALEAAEAGQSLSLGTVPLAQLQAIEAQWQAAIAELQAVPTDVLVAATIAARLQDYQRQHRAIAYRVDVAQSGFLEEIATAMGNPEHVRITVCQVESRDCRYWQGQEPPASPASLIKVPVAVALMDKVMREQISLDTKILVSPSNYTEDPQGSNIWTGREYTLRELMTRMIDHSSNVATNQLIDFIGYDYINQVMRDRGYSVTLVESKLVGEYTYPDDLGTGPNRINAAELTDMMVGIYNQEHPGDAEILSALVQQYDWALGYDAVTPTKAAWVGEKTGQNSEVIGSTTAVNVGGLDGDRYIITLTMDYTANEATLRQGIRAVVEHILKNGQL